MNRALLFLLASICLLATSATAEEKKKSGGPPPMLVTTAKIINGKAEPTASFVGTVYFSRTAEVAAEVEGLVEKVFIEDGQRVGIGDRLIRLDDDLLATEINATRALFEQNQIDVKQAEKDYQRIASLHKQEAIATSEYEAYDTRLNRLQKQSTVLKARLDKQLLEQKKKTVRAPFDGKIIENLVEAGEWVKAGGVIATLADDRGLEAHIDIPSNIIPYLSRDKAVDLSVAGQNSTGTFISVIPRGDVSTRTFTAKFKLAQTSGFIEGMEAQASLPTSSSSESMLVPRDAVINSYGKKAVFIHNNGTAQMVTVEVAGYTGDMVGVKADALAIDQDVVVKGSERIRDGQAVRTE